jgi:hypothetical protein
MKKPTDSEVDRGFAEWLEDKGYDWYDEGGPADPFRVAERTWRAAVEWTIEQLEKHK